MPCSFSWPPFQTTVIMIYCHELHLRLCKNLRCSFWGFCSFPEDSMHAHSDLSGVCPSCPVTAATDCSAPKNLTWISRRKWMHGTMQSVQSWVTDNCVECFPLVTNLSIYEKLDFKSFENCLITLPRLMASNNCFSKIIVDVFLPCKMIKTSAFIEVVTLSEDQLIKVHFISSTWLLIILLITMKELRLC